MSKAKTLSKLLHQIQIHVIWIRFGSRSCWIRIGPNWHARIWHESGSGQIAKFWILCTPNHNRTEPKGPEDTTTHNRTRTALYFSLLQRTRSERNPSSECSSPSRLLSWWACIATCPDLSLSLVICNHSRPRMKWIIQTEARVRVLVMHVCALTTWFTFARSFIIASIGTVWITFCTQNSLYTNLHSLYYYCLPNYTVSQKRDPNIIDCNFKKDWFSRFLAQIFLTHHHHHHYLACTTSVRSSACYQ